MPSKRYTPEQITHHLRAAEVLLSQGMTTCIYIARLVTPHYTKSIKMVLLK